VQRSLADFSLADLEALFASWGVRPQHAGSVLRAYYRGAWTAGGSPVDSLRANHTGPDAWPKALSARLSESLGRPGATLAARQLAADGTTKLLLQLGDGRTVESVLMPDYRDDRAAGCISSQVGCAMRCDFCATTKTGFERHLSAGEIVEQFIALRREAAAIGRTLQTLVFMGMGEPMLNLDNVIAAARRIGDNRIGGLGWRQITISTVGIIAGIDALTATDLNVNLAVSLHAANDATRTSLLPAGKAYPIDAVLAAADRFQASRGRPVTIQYCLLRGVNDSSADARALASLLAHRRMHVNLLRYNSTGVSLQGRDYEPATDEAADAFVTELRARGVVAHFRRSRGPDIDAACGQLRRRVAAAQ
jgi:23S rRNA (adenine2503-C2)-methyltransferase